MGTQETTYYRLVVELYGDTDLAATEAVKRQIEALPDVYEVDVEKSPDQATWR